MTTRFALAALAACLSQPAVAQDAGFYFGLGVIVQHAETSATDFDGFTPTASDLGLALTGGYRFAAAGNLSYGVEGNLDLMSGERMSDDRDACTSTAPTWCEVDQILRIRGTLTTALDSGSRVTASLGAVRVSGLAEDGPFTFVDTTGTGLSLGLAWETGATGLPLRIDVNYDSINSDDADNYERDLDLIGLRVSYMF